MENSSSNQDPWCSPGVTALVTGAVVGAASYFGSRFFVPQNTFQEKDERIKFREAFEEYKRQVEFDREESNLIKELLNEYTQKLEHISNIVSQLLIENDDTESSSSKPMVRSKRNDNFSEADEELEKQLYSLLNTYPYIARLEDFNFHNVKQCTTDREKHHALVVSLAEIVFSKLSSIEENGIRAYEKYKYDHAKMAFK